MTFIAEAGAHLATFFAALLLAAFMPIQRAAVAAVALACCLAAWLIPHSGTTGHILVRTAIASFSSSFFVAAIFSLAAFAAQRPVVERNDELLFAVLVAALGLVLYGSVLGYLPFDLYRFGYDPRAIVTFGMCSIVLGLLFRSLMVLIWATAALLSWRAGLVDSSNVFDHVIDVPAWAASLVLSAVHAWPALTGKYFFYPGWRLSSRLGISRNL